MCANYEYPHNESLLKIIHSGEEQRPLVSVTLLLNVRGASWNNSCLLSSCEVLPWGQQLPQRTALGKHLPSFTLIWKDTVLNLEFILRKILVLISCSGNNYNIYHVFDSKFIPFFRSPGICLKLYLATDFTHPKQNLFTLAFLPKVCFLISCGVLILRFRGNRDHLA